MSQNWSGVLSFLSEGTGTGNCAISGYARGTGYCVVCWVIMAVALQKETLVVATKEIGLEVNADKTKYMVMCREQTAGLSHTMKVDDSSIERAEEFKYLGTTLTNQNSIQKEIKRRLKLGNACYHSVQNLLSSTLLSKNL